MNKMRYKIFIIAATLLLSSTAQGADAVIITKIKPRILRLNESATLTLKGFGFEQDAAIDLGEGITIIATQITENEITAQIKVASETSIGFRKITVTNKSGGVGCRPLGLLVLRCTTDCQFEGNAIPIHDKNSDQYRPDCTSAACHKGILTEKTSDRSLSSFHVLKVKKLKVIPGNTVDEKCVYCHKDTDLVENSAGNLRRNVDVGLCSACHTANGPGNEIYQAKTRGLK